MSDLLDRGTKYIHLVNRMGSPATLEMHIQAVIHGVRLDREEAINRLYELYKSKPVESDAMPGQGAIPSEAGSMA